MGRLVDIDEVIRVAENTLPQEDVRKIAWVLCYTPTAYDVEKVVAEIRRRSGNGYRDVDGDYVPPLIKTANAIDIVERGGVDERT